MIRNYFKTAWRNILRNKFYASINVIGLTVGLTVGLLILLWVNDELNFDGFHKKSKQIYQMEAQIGTGTSKQTWGGVPAPIATHAVKEIPEVVNSVRIGQNYDYAIFRYKDKLLPAGENGAYYTEPSLFKIFDFKLLRGNANNPFPDLHSIIITESTAKRFFDDADPIGKVLLADNRDNYTVAGILPDFPEKSTLKADMLFSFDVVKKNFGGNGNWKTVEDDWGDYFYQTFLLLRPGASPQTVANKLTAIHQSAQKEAVGAGLNYKMQALEKIHLYNPDGTPAGLQTVKIFLIVAILILLIACINYVNLSTARAMMRSKEVSVRKIIGAERLQLFAQFIIETTLFFSIALILSCIAVKLLMPVYNNISGKQMTFDLMDLAVWKVIGLIAICTLAASSIYPALLLSSFKPISALKGKISLGIGNALFRKALVVTQFIFSIGLIIGTLIINNQLKYIREKDPGYDRSQVFSFGMRDMQKNYQGIRAELLEQPGIKAVTSAQDNIVSIDGNTGDTDWDGKAPNQSFLIHPMSIDREYFKFFKLKLADGDSFLGVAADSAHYILNETAVREIGMKNPVGKRFKLHDRDGIIVGVVKDFNFASLKQKIEPFIFYYRPGNNWRMFVKTSGKDAPRALEAVRNVWKKYNSAFPFDYSFLDDDYDHMYKSDQRSGKLFSAFAGIAIFISCLGLFGLATYTSQVKIKEIGIRKVLGASVTNITTMLSKDFMALIVISLVIASPVAWFLMGKWLQDYAYRVNIEWWVFALAGLATIVIASMTISYQAIKAALMNPVKTLRSE